MQFAQIDLAPGQQTALTTTVATTLSTHNTFDSRSQAAASRILWDHQFRTLLRACKLLRTCTLLRILHSYVLVHSCFLTRRALQRMLTAAAQPIRPKGTTKETAAREDQHPGTERHQALHNAHLDGLMG
eukprot:2666957-Pleurochrysis_carterae.AAC.1